MVGLGARALVVPGARVDVLVTRDGGGAAGTELALEDVEVLAARPASAGARDEGGERVAATLRVSVRDAVYLAAAQSFARELRLLPRARRRRRAQRPDRGRPGAALRGAAGAADTERPVSAMTGRAAGAPRRRRRP